MKAFFVYAACVLLPVFGCFGENEDNSQIIPATSQPTTSQLQPINIKIEPLSEEQKQANLSINLLRETIMNALDEARISVNEQLDQPMLVLKIRSIQVGLDIATFFNLSLLEQAMLVRNRGMFNAATWSQTALLSCPPEKLKKEILETVQTMATNFAKEYVKALQPAQ